MTVEHAAARTDGGPPAGAQRLRGNLGIPAIVFMVLAGAEPLGTISIPGIRFGRIVTPRDFRLDGRAETVDHRDRDFKGVEQDYPSRAYSPLFVVADDSTAIGVSVLYPVLDYNHEVRMQLPPRAGCTPPRGGAGNWTCT